jgi:hypothetical protein
MHFISRTVNKLISLFSDLLKDIEHYRNNYQKETDAVMKKRTLLQIQRSLLKCQELGDEKLQVVSQIIENIENRSRQLEQDLENLGETLSKFGSAGDFLSFNQILANRANFHNSMVKLNTFMAE